MILIVCIFYITKISFLKSVITDDLCFTIFNSHCDSVGALSTGMFGATAMLDV